ncbi:hypothetical protein EVAR_101127_1 [Eumeta japonica]|uniref:Uncharacterized protein n=1 Tax=Eumeta variegata TaxID=151549 RepID=A0A4C2AG76_EUMVA|nr:hypothetical protein EVAR_101127_1 [Eumeta japonica]
MSDGGGTGPPEFSIIERDATAEVAASNLYTDILLSLDERPLRRVLAASRGGGRRPPPRPPAARRPATHGPTLRIVHAIHRELTVRASINCIHLPHGTAARCGPAPRLTHTSNASALPQGQVEYLRSAATYAQDGADEPSTSTVLPTLTYPFNSLNSQIFPSNKSSPCDNVRDFVYSTVETYPATILLFQNDVLEPLALHASHVQLEAVKDYRHQCGHSVWD